MRPTGERHRFRVLIETEGDTASASIHFPPGCAAHPGSKVVRKGTYGTPATKRQRYQCVPADGSKPHTFTQPLSRAAVDYGVDDCPVCDELLSPYRGTLTGGRHTPWTLDVYAQALNDLSLGESYARVSIAMRGRLQSGGHTHPVADVSVPDVVQQVVGVTLDGEMAKNAWHLAADLVETCAPVLWDNVMPAAAARAAEQRAVNDRWKAENPAVPVPYPVTYILDEQPVYLRDATTRKSMPAWSILAVTEVVLHPPDFPGDFPIRENRLRLARAMPNASTEAWRLVLDELGVRPDLVIADFAQNIRSAVVAEYGPDVEFIPSLYHLHVNLRRQLLKINQGKQTSTLVGKRKVLIPELRDRLHELDRDQLFTSDNPSDWAAWWDDFIATLVQLGLPADVFLGQRATYEKPVADAMPLMAARRYLPASNAAVEAHIARTLAPFLQGRKHLLRNIARTNRLLDLAVVRNYGGFSDLEKVKKWLRRDNEQHGGWTATPRDVTDRQPPTPPGKRKPNARTGKPKGMTKQEYASLTNDALVTALHEQRVGAERQPARPMRASRAKRAKQPRRPS